MRFVCLGYAEESKWDAMSKAEQAAMIDECFAYDAVLQNAGYVAGGEALQSVRAARTLSWKDGKVVVTDGPFAETKEQLGGFFVLEVGDMARSVELLSKHPGVRHSSFEIRPVEVSPDCLPPPAQPPTASQGARFVCLGFQAEDVWEAMPKSEKDAFLSECTAYDDMLRKNGHWLGGEALQSARTAKTLRWKQGKVLVTDGPYAETKEQFGGAVMLAARDMNHAVELMSQHPGIRLGVRLEIRGTDEQINALYAERMQQAQSVS